MDNNRNYVSDIVHFNNKQSAMAQINIYDRPDFAINDLLGFGLSTYGRSLMEIFDDNNSKIGSMEYGNDNTVNIYYVSMAVYNNKVNHDYDAITLDMYNN